MRANGLIVFGLAVSDGMAAEQLLMNVSPIMRMKRVEKTFPFPMRSPTLVMGKTS